MTTTGTAVLCRPGASEAHVPRAAFEAVRAIRPIEAWLTGRDARNLEEHLAECERTGAGVYPLLCELIRAKLEDAVLLGPHDFGPDLATGGSRVAYALDGRLRESRVLCHRGDGGIALPVRTLLGATLLGMRVGQRAPFPGADGTTGTVDLLEVSWQPEAGRRPGEGMPG